MSIHQLKESLHKLIDRIEDTELLAAVYKIISVGQGLDAEVHLTEAERKAISLGLDDIEAGNFSSHEEVQAKVNDLFKK
ncbi:MAG: hypothetical protein AAFR61_03300 [Bacteroidota bacterium]